MAKRIVLPDEVRIRNGATYVFTVYIEHGMIYIVGDGDKEAVTDSSAGSRGFLIDDGIRSILRRGKVQAAA